MNRPTVREIWSTKALGELCTLVNGRPFKPSDWSQSGIPIIRIQNLNDRSKPFNHYAGSFDPKHHVQSGDILLSWSGTPGTSFGCFIWDRQPGVLNQHIFKVHVDRAYCEPEYFVLAVNSILDEMISQAHGGVGLRHITKAKLESIQLPLAPIDEQPAIVQRANACFSLMGDIEATGVAIAKESKALVGAVLNDFDNSFEGNRVPVEEIVLASQNGRSVRQSETSGNARVLTLSSVRNVLLDCESAKTVTIDNATALKYAIKPGDVFVSRSNTVDLVGLSSYSANSCSAWTIYPDLLIKLTADTKQVLSPFLAYALRVPSVREQIKSFAKGTSQSMVKISGSSLRKVKIPLPPLREQELLVSRFDSAQRLSLGITEALDLRRIPALRRSVLRQAVAGEL